MTSKNTVTVLEIGGELYVYHGDKLHSTHDVTEVSNRTIFEDIRSETLELKKEFKHISVSHTDWNYLMDWLDRVSTVSLSSLLDSAGYRRMVISYLTEGVAH